MRKGIRSKMNSESLRQSQSIHGNKKGDESKPSQTSITLKSATQVCPNRFAEFLRSGHLVDVTLACDGKEIKAHKLMLASCSRYFRETLRMITHHHHPIVLMKGIEFEVLKSVVHFIYFGEILLQRQDMYKFVDAANYLEVDGIKSFLENPNFRQETTGNHPKMEETLNVSPLHTYDINSFSHGSTIKQIRTMESASRSNQYLGQKNIKITHEILNKSESVSDDILNVSKCISSKCKLKRSTMSAEIFEKSRNPDLQSHLHQGETNEALVFPNHSLSTHASPEVALDLSTGTSYPNSQSTDSIYYGAKKHYIMSTDSSSVYATKRNTNPKAIPEMNTHHNATQQISCQSRNACDANEHTTGIPTSLAPTSDADLCQATEIQFTTAQKRHNCSLHISPSSDKSNEGRNMTMRFSVPYKPYFGKTPCSSASVKPVAESVLTISSVQTANSKCEVDSLMLVRDLSLDCDASMLKKL